MNVLSLFDGMSCGRIALERADIQVNKYYASELDKYAIKVAQANWPETIQLGDVTKWREWDIDWSSIDLLIGGSPCQGFSFAGKQLAFDDPRSKLFFVYVDILNHIKRIRKIAGKPELKFMLENVKMKKEFLNVISEKLGVVPVFINSALVSAQNRQRYYWCSWEVSQPEDKGLVLADIVEHSVDEKYQLSEKLLKGFESKINRRAEKKSGFDKFNVRPLGEKVSCLTARYYKTAMSDPFIEIRSAAMVGRKINPETGKRDDNNKALKAVQCLEVNSHGKSRCISTVSKDSLVSDLPPGRHIDYERKSYRKLTPIECERLQTVPDNYTNHVSNTQRYKMLGNGWTVDVIAHIFKGI
ncbi:putative DNA-methyltransferase [Pseudoalteromonas phage vB_PspS-H40/1]|uniref:putative DNA-methyltransferase n=1 Tax=Pseudoalteromonas phage vB_PspS-H40/1 TaxID=1856120 RepID=UPI0007DDAE79|nr:putative DNA-methyltransferase [Pseudoalteromonas phage vB_PspS-H40/1]ANI22039.1 putative DNA-methyltransferase [Pseudoalteromonas phage vB_PspS-H40/1]